MEKNDNLQEMLHDEVVAVPDSLLPDQIRKKLKELDEKEFHDVQPCSSRTMSRGGSLVKRLCIGGAAAAAAACIAVAAFAYHPFRDDGGIGLSEAGQGRQSGAGGAAGTDAVPGSSGDPDNAPAAGNSGDNYALAFDNMNEYEKMRGEQKTEYKNYEENYETETSSGGAGDDTAKNGSVHSDTNVRTAGVDEGDIVKTDGKHIYICDRTRGKVFIYLANGKKPRKVASISLKKKTSYLTDLYVRGDRLVVVGVQYDPSMKQIKAMYEAENQNFENFNKKSWSSGWGCCGTEKQGDVGPAVYMKTFIYNLDNPEKPALMHEFFQDGSYMDSRMAGETLYLFSDRSFDTANIRKKKITSYVPQIGGECVGDEGISVQEQVVGGEYAVMSSINIADCSYIDKYAVLSGIDCRLYVSGKHIYLLGDQCGGTADKSTVMKLSYGGGKIKKVATGKYRGYVLNDYCIDEKDGCLRLVTTYFDKKDRARNGLFVMDENLKVTGKLTNLAKNEEIYSARFIDDTAYFVTYRNTDPLFAVDVSDAKSPKLLGYLKIPGFSRYLHPYNDHLLLGMGVETAGGDSDMTKGIKLSMFDISDPTNVREVAKTVLDGYVESEAEYNPNALFIDVEKNLFGFDAVDYKKNKYDYMVYSYDGKKGFVRKFVCGFSENEEYEGGGVRGIYIDNYFYVVSVGNRIVSYDLAGFKKLGSVGM